MDYHKEIRQSYLGGAPILLMEGFFWILAGFIWDAISFKMGFFVMIISGILFYPLGQLLQIILKRPKISKDNPLKLLFTQISLTIPFVFPLILLTANGDYNLFFPALTIIIGAHFLPFIYAYQMKIFWVLASVLVAGGSLFGFMAPYNIHYCAYYTGVILLLFGFINGYLVSKEIKN